MKNIWLLYEERDLQVNRDYVAAMRKAGKQLDLNIRAVTVEELSLTMDAMGIPGLLTEDDDSRPDAVISRMRLPLYSRHFELMDIPIFNGSKVCEICNDKRYTHQFLKGLPMPSTVFLAGNAYEPTVYPKVVKPACSHGGDRVKLVKNIAEYRMAVEDVLPEPGLVQDAAQNSGWDLRVYVLFGQIVAGVMRHATKKEEIISNYKQGGAVELHTLTRDEESLAKEVIRRFEQAGAPLCFAGIDFLFDTDGPVIGEVEDVVGSRMLYKTSDIDIISLYLKEIKNRI